MDIPVVANVLGTLGAVCWSVQLIPQIVVNYRRHHATGLQQSMMMLWAWAGVPLGVYNIVKEFNIALLIQPQILTFLSLITWIQCFYYQRNWTIIRCLLVVVPVAIVMGGIQAALVVGLRISASRHVDWPLTLMATLSAVLLAAGVLRHYWDIWIHRTVRGISFLFVAIDAAGDLFSLTSVIFQPTLDILGMAIYGTELILWLGVFTCGGYYNFVPWMRKKWHTNSPRRGRLENQDLDIPTLTGMTHIPIALHSMPSSTSVFRTASSELSGPRPRTVPSMRRNRSGQDNASVHTVP